MLEDIRNCYRVGKVLFSGHAKNEMDEEEFGRIIENEVNEVVLNGRIIEHYSDDTPYPSCLIFGRTEKNRPLHVVCAYSGDDDLAIIITVYQPDPQKWINYERRKL